MSDHHRELPESIFRSIVDGTAYPFVLITTDGTVLFASASIADLLGWVPEEVVGRNIAEFLDAEELTTAITAIEEIEAINRSGAGVPMVFHVLRRDGTRRWLEVGAMPMLDEPGIEAIALRLRPQDAQQHFDDFLARLLAGEPLDEVLAALSRSITESLDALGVVIHHNFDGRAFAGSAGHGIPLDLLPRDRGPWCQAVLEREERVCSKVDIDPVIKSANPELRACFTVPILVGSVAPAALSVWRREPGPLLIGHKLVLERSARYVELALVRSAEHQRLRHLAGHDALTGVANRTQFRHRLAAALGMGERNLALAFCDLDGFKPVNDTWGHVAGDAVLIEVAARLREHVRAGDELARVGGDEFTVLLRNVADAGAAAEVANRLLGAVGRPFPIGDSEVSLGMSVGVALSRPDDTADDLVARADAALYRVKRSGGAHTHVAS